jgi:methylglutaconyl-CoA hydratase
MRDALEEVPMDPEIRAVILTSDVERVFCAGADLKERRDMTQLVAGMFVSTRRNTFTALGALGPPGRAAVGGAALGGGLEIALACDIRIAGEKVRGVVGWVGGRDGKGGGRERKHFVLN